MRNLFSKGVKTNPKTFFKCASKLNYSRKIPSLKDGNKSINKNQENAEIFNIIFTSVYQKSATIPEFKTPSEITVTLFPLVSTKVTLPVPIPNEERKLT